jgi:hypothetical protein
MNFKNTIGGRREEANRNYNNNCCTSNLFAMKERIKHINTNQKNNKQGTLKWYRNKKQKTKKNKKTSVNYNTRKDVVHVKHNL